MNAQQTEKSPYIQPELIKVKLDNEISLQLESLPPVFESKNTGGASDYFNDDPFHIHIS